MHFLYYILPITEDSRQVFTLDLSIDGISFHARVEDGYHELIARDPERFVVVDATKSRDEIAAEIQEKVLTRLMENEK